MPDMKYKVAAKGIGRTDYSQDKPHGALSKEEQRKRDACGGNR